MKRIFSVVTLVGLLIASPIALAQKPGKNNKEDEQPFGQPRNQPRSTPKPVQPQRNPQPVRRQPQNPALRQLPRAPQEDPRGRNPGKVNDGGNKQPNNQPQGDPRRLNPQQPVGPRQQPNLNPPKTGNDAQPRSLPKRFQPDQPQTGKRDAAPSPFSTRKPEVNAPSRGDGKPQNGLSKIGDGGRTDPGRAPAKLDDVGKVPVIDPPSRGGDGGARSRLAPVNPSGKPRTFDGGAAKTGVQPLDTGNAPKSGDQPQPNGGRRQLGRPSQPNPRNDKITEAAATAGPGTAQPLKTTAQPLKTTAVPTTTSGNVKGVDAPARMQRIPKQVAARGGDSGERDFDRVKTRGPERHKKQVSHVDPVVHHPPEGGRLYRHGDYHHEYQSRSSWSLGIGVSDGGTSFAFGYSSGGGCYPGYSPCAYNPYWHPTCYSPVIYQPCYPVYPVYYAPVYQPVWVDPYAYNSSSFAFGYSSFGGSALSSFSFAYSSSNWGVGFGWASAPAYTIYTPVYDPYFRSVWVPGYYQIVDERAWVPGRYEEVVSTPVVETIVDPLGNTYDTVTSPGSVDYLWREGYWTVESRRLWVPGHFEYVAVF
jgi:hypothetical protein